ITSSHAFSRASYLLHHLAPDRLSLRCHGDGGWRGPQTGDPAVLLGGGGGGPNCGVLGPREGFAPQLPKHRAGHQRSAGHTQGLPQVPAAV
ncbi:hypothetical protein CRUP_000145, partial [Coryphaenoides rupestris]